MPQTEDWRVKRDREQLLAKTATRRLNEELRAEGYEARVVLYPIEKPSS